MNLFLLYTHARTQYREKERTKSFLFAYDFKSKNQDYIAM